MTQYVMVRNDTMAAAGLLAIADYARQRKNKSHFLIHADFMLSTGLAEVDQHSIKVTLKVKLVFCNNNNYHYYHFRETHILAD